MVYKSLAKPYLFSKGAEQAHELTIQMAEKVHNSSLLRTLASTLYRYRHPTLRREFFGLEFPNPVGIAAGFDKNGVTIGALEALGLGFVEVGSITAKPSDGNPKPRAFRLPQDRSLINRMGLNNQGADEIIKRLTGLKTQIPIGVNIAKTNDASIHGDEAIKDYLYSYTLARSVADYITVNISCPNTGEGKTFEDPDALLALLEGLKPELKKGTPTLIKFSVDTEKEALQKLLDLCERFGINGYIATNTSSARSGLKTDPKELKEIGNGGLSGRAIREKSTRMVSWLYEFLQGKKPIIGVGGIDSPESALEKLEAGADLLQIYTGLVYEGPSLVSQINRKIVTEGSRS